MPKTKTPAVETPKLNRPLCVVCKSRFAFNDDGTCNDPSCPSYSTRVKARAAGMKAERRALEANVAEGRAERTELRGKDTSPSKVPTRPVGATSTPKAATVASKTENVPTHAVGAKNGVSIPTPAPVETKRTVGWRWRSEDRRFGLLEITDGKAIDAYLVKWLATRAGIHQLTMTKLEVGRETCYWVYVPAKSSDLSAASGCGCPGMASHRHCRHVEALIELRDSGRL